MYGRLYQLQPTFVWIQDILLTRSYVDGTRYYPTAEWFLLYVNRLVQTSKDPIVGEKLKGPLRECIQERIGTGGDALCLAMRVIVCCDLGVPNPLEVEKLLSLQCADGGWDPCYLYRYPGVNKELGNRGVSTAFAIKALAAVQGRKLRS